MNKIFLALSLIATGLLVYLRYLTAPLFITHHAITHTPSLLLPLSLLFLFSGILLLLVSLIVVAGENKPEV